MTQWRQHFPISPCVLIYTFCLFIFQVLPSWVGLACSYTEKDQISDTNKRQQKIKSVIRTELAPNGTIKSTKLYGTHTGSEMDSGIFGARARSFKKNPYNCLGKTEVPFGYSFFFSVRHLFNISGIGKGAGSSNKSISSTTVGGRRRKRIESSSFFFRAKFPRLVFPFGV